MELHEFWYELPERLIAQKPLEKRSDSRLLVLERNTKKMLHEKFDKVVEYINEGDCIVFNNSKVIPARLYGKKIGTGADIEFVLLKRIEKDIWEVILRPGKRAKLGSEFIFGDCLLAKVLDIIDDGVRIVKFSYDGVFEDILDRIGIIPLPPYITEKLDDRERYQTIYAKNPGSAAAPTAGLHFTEEILNLLKNKGVDIAYITLHVGLGTFRPVKVSNIEEHKMHSEYFEINDEAAEIINKTKKNKKRVIAVGTTSMRVLETVAQEDGYVKSTKGSTDIFIYPGFKFKVVDALITNFHLPESTLLMLVCAFAGKEFVMEAYREAVEKEYRFFSFGDAMLIL